MSHVDATVAVLLAVSGLWFGCWYAPPAAIFVTSLLDRRPNEGGQPSSTTDLGIGLTLSLIGLLPAYLFFRTLENHGHPAAAIGIAAVSVGVSALVFLICAITKASNARAEARRAQHWGLRRDDWLVTVASSGGVDAPRENRGFAY